MFVNCPVIFIERHVVPRGHNIIYFRIALCTAQKLAAANLVPNRLYAPVQIRAHAACMILVVQHNNNVAALQHACYNRLVAVRTNPLGIRIDNIQNYLRLCGRVPLRIRLNTDRYANVPVFGEFLAVNAVLLKAFNTKTVIPSRKGRQRDACQQKRYTQKNTQNPFHNTNLPLIYLFAFDKN